jgi:hypothetical protein
MVGNGYILAEIPDLPREMTACRCALVTSLFYPRAQRNYLKQHGLFQVLGKSDGERVYSRRNSRSPPRNDSLSLRASDEPVLSESHRNYLKQHGLFHALCKIRHGKEALFSPVGARRQKK